MIVLMNPFLAALAAALNEHVASGNYSGPLYGGSVQLFTNNVSLNPETLLADLTKPTYGTYADVAATWSSVYVNPNGNYSILSQLFTFQTSGGDPLTTITGYGYYTGTSPKVLQFGEVFQNPFAMTTSLVPLNFVVEFPLAPTAAGGATIIG